jgi:hypothetical protein
MRTTLVIKLARNFLFRMVQTNFVPESSVPRVKYQMDSVKTVLTNLHRFAVFIALERNTVLNFECSCCHCVQVGWCSFHHVKLCEAAIPFCHRRYIYYSPRCWHFIFLQLRRTTIRLCHCKSSCDHLIRQSKFCCLRRHVTMMVTGRMQQYVCQQAVLDWRLSVPYPIPVFSTQK